VEYKKSKQNAKNVISLVKGKKQKEFASDLNDPNQQNEIFRIAKQMVKERRDITGSNCLKGASGVSKHTSAISTIRQFPEICGQPCGR